MHRVLCKSSCRHSPSLRDPAGRTAPSAWNTAATPGLPHSHPRDSLATFAGSPHSCTSSFFLVYFLVFTETILQHDLLEKGPVRGELFQCFAWLNWLNCFYCVPQLTQVSNFHVGSHFPLEFWKCCSLILKLLGCSQEFQIGPDSCSILCDCLRVFSSSLEWWLLKYGSRCGAVFITRWCFQSGKSGTSALGNFPEWFPWGFSLLWFYLSSLWYSCYSGIE